jgi:D-hydroxyproline dehydrogenase subunit gamma
MPDEIALIVNGTRVMVPAGATVAVAVALVGHACRRSVSGEPRGPLCGMGICFECRIAINGQPHCRGCQVICKDGMDVRTNDVRTND